MQTENNLRLDNKTVVITGAAGFIGSDAAKSIAMLGADLILIDIDKKKMDTLVKDIKKITPCNIKIFITDINSPSQAKKIFSYLSKDKVVVDVLINATGMVGTTKEKGWNTTFDKQKINAWRKALETNLTSTFFLIQALIKYMKKSKDPTIINISSIYGSSAPDYSIYEGTKIFNPAAYGVSKAGVIYMTKWLATTLAPNIRVNCVSPGGIYRNQDKKFVAKYSKKTPLNRMAKEDDITGCILFLSSSLSKYITGQNIIIDGGWTL